MRKAPPSSRQAPPNWRAAAARASAEATCSRSLRRCNGITSSASRPPPRASSVAKYRQPRSARKLALRPESIILLPAGAASSEPSLPGIIRQQQLLGNVIRYQVECEAGLLTVDCLNRSAGDLLATGSAVTLAVARDQLCEVA